MRYKNRTPDCESRRPELVPFLYGELDGPVRAALEQHLLDCAACRDELTSLRDTRELLGRWQVSPAADDPRALARTIRELASPASAPAPAAVRARVPRRRLVRLVAALSGVAAALLFVLSLLGARASYTDGRFELSLALPGAAPASFAPLAPAELEQHLRRIAAQEVAAHVADLEQDQQTLVERLVRMNREEFLRLTRAVDLARAQDQRLWGERFALLARESDLQGEVLARTRQDFVQFASAVAPAVAPRMFRSAPNTQPR
jgi:hypothetical protein